MCRAAGRFAPLRHLQVHKFLKSRNVRDLGAAANLSASALYDLAAKHRHSVYTPKAIEAIFNEAQQKRVGANRAYDIASSLQPQTEEEIEAEIEAARAAEEQEAAEQAEAEAILDGPPPARPFHKRPMFSESRLVPSDSGDFTPGG
jgi:hypothetical protein